MKFANNPIPVYSHIESHWFHWDKNCVILDIFYINIYIFRLGSDFITLKYTSLCAAKDFSHKVPYIFHFVPSVRWTCLPKVAKLELSSDWNRSKYVKVFNLLCPRLQFILLGPWSLISLSRTWESVSVRDKIKL